MLRPTKNTEGDWIEIDSALENVEDAVEQVLCRVDANALPNEKLFGLRLALHEAIANAITHGNRNHPDLPVSIRYLRTPEHVEVTIRDQGNGFDCQAVPDPTQGTNIFQCSGRGIYLMRKLVDSVDYNERGNEVTLVVNTS